MSSENTAAKSASQVVEPPLEGRTLETTDDVFLGGLLTLRQPANGYRAGLDAMVLAATVDAAFSGHLVDVGAGVGGVGLAVAVRCPQARVTLIERDPALCDLARHNVTALGLAHRVSLVELDATAPDGESCTVLSKSAPSLILCNPPFYAEGAGTPARDARRAAAHAMPENALDAWLRFIARIAGPHARATLIHRADALPQIIAAMRGRFGGIDILPLHARTNSPAHRILVSGIKGSAAPITMRFGRTVHNEERGFTPEFEAILRSGAALAW